MLTNVKFGEFLKLLLSALDISINRLSKAINVDSSLVNRWINGKRIPPYNTLYIESISEYLSKNVQNTFQMQHLNELLLNVNEDNESAVDLKEKIKKALKEAQGYSYECKKEETKAITTHMKNKEEISKSLTNNNFDFERENSISDEPYTWNAPNHINSIPLSSNDKIIFGIKNIFTAGISLLETAVSQQCKDNNIIYITYNNDLDIKAFSCNELMLWRDLLLNALNNGWYVIFLLRLNNNINRTIKFMNFVLPLMKTGRFNIYYFKKYGVFATERELYVISGIGALSCFSTNPNSEISCAFYLENKAAVDILKDYFNVLLETYAKPLIKYYSQDINSEYCCYLTEIEEDIGNRLIYNYGFSMLLLPENLYKKLIKRKNIPQCEKLTTLQYYKKQLNAIITNIHNYEYKDIYFADSIKILIKHRQFYLYTYSGVEIIELEVQDIIEFLHNIINLLKTYDNYNIAFISRNADSPIKIDDCYFMVKERHSVFFEVFEPSKNIPKVRLTIEEPMIVNAFNEYFNDIWEQIAPVNKDKGEVIEWLQNQINSFKDN